MSERSELRRADDLVAELDRWLIDWPLEDCAPLMYRARNEIIALRRTTLPALARERALEEAARVCEGGYTTGSTGSTLKAIAAAIRALKEKRNEPGSAQSRGGGSAPAR